MTCFAARQCLSHTVQPCNEKNSRRNSAVQKTTENEIGTREAESETAIGVEKVERLLFSHEESVSTDFCRTPQNNKQRTTQYRNNETLS